MDGVCRDTRYNAVITLLEDDSDICIRGATRRRQSRLEFLFLHILTRGRPVLLWGGGVWLYKKGADGCWGTGWCGSFRGFGVR